MDEPHGLSSSGWHLEGWTSSSFSFFPDFVGKMQNLAIPDAMFKGFIITSRHKFIGMDEDEILLCLCMLSFVMLRKHSS